MEAEGKALEWTVGWDGLGYGVAALDTDMKLFSWVQYRPRWACVSTGFESVRSLDVFCLEGSFVLAQCSIVLFDSKTQACNQKILSHESIYW